MKLKFKWQMNDYQQVCSCYIPVFSKIFCDASAYVSITPNYISKKWKFDFLGKYYEYYELDAAKRKAETLIKKEIERVKKKLNSLSF